MFYRRSACPSDWSGRPFKVLDMIKYTFATTTLLIILLGCIFTNCESQVEFQPSAEINHVDQLSDTAVYDFKWSIIRYVGRKPEDASHENKFHSYFDEHYHNQARTHQLEFYHATPEKTFFILSRIAPSTQLKHVAIGGYVVLDENNEVRELEEVFRTWKRTPEELKPINQLLFERMMAQDDLSVYYTKNMGLDAYIEFPNDEVWYNKASNTWMSSREDVLQEFYDEKIKRTQQKIDSLEIQ